MQTTTTTLIPTQRGRFVDPDGLICPGCGEQVRCTPPGYWAVRDGLPVPQFSHHDATPLCRTGTGNGTGTGTGTVADPIETAR